MSEFLQAKDKNIPELVFLSFKCLVAEPWFYLICYFWVNLDKIAMIQDGQPQPQFIL